MAPTVAGSATSEPDEAVQSAARLFSENETRLPATGSRDCHVRSSATDDEVKEADETAQTAAGISSENETRSATVATMAGSRDLHVRSSAAADEAKESSENETRSATAAAAAGPRDRHARNSEPADEAKQSSENDTWSATVGAMAGSRDGHVRSSAMKDEAWRLLQQSTVYCNGKPVGTSDQMHLDSVREDQEEFSGVHEVWQTSLLCKWNGRKRFLNAEVLGSFCLLIIELVLYLIEKYGKIDGKAIRIANFCMGLIFTAYSAIMVSTKAQKAFCSSEPEISLQDRKRIFGLFEPIDVVECGLVLVYVSTVTDDFVRLLCGKRSFSYPSAPFWVSVLIFVARFFGPALWTVSLYSDIESCRPWDSPVNCGTDHPVVSAAGIPYFGHHGIALTRKMSVPVGQESKCGFVLCVLQVSVTNFVPCGLALLMSGKPQKRQIVQNFLQETIKLVGRGKIGVFTVDKGVMPSAFRVVRRSHSKREMLVADSGAITPFEAMASLASGLWWIILLRAYAKSSGDALLHTVPQIQRGIKTILNVNFEFLSLAASIGTEGRSIEREILLYFAMRCAEEMLEKSKANMEMFGNISKQALKQREFIQLNFWFDETKLQETNLPRELANFVRKEGGYFIGEVQGRKRNLQWISATNLMAIVSGLATMEQSKAIMNLIDANWEKLVGEMPLKRVFPAEYWEIASQVDGQNEIWSQCDNASWPGMLWLLTAGCMAARRPDMAKKAISLAEERLAAFRWPEYYGGEIGRNAGSLTSQNYVPTIGSYLASALIIENPKNLSMITI